MNTAFLFSKSLFSRKKRRSREEKLKEEETRKFLNNSFRDGTLKTTGTDIDKILPPASRFGGGTRAAKKQSVIARLMQFFEKYPGLV